jgi:3-hydroxyisobutyryl-CoA hydrolase
MNRNQRHNAINNQMYQLMRQKVRQESARQSSRWILQLGGEKAFCSGADVVELTSNPEKFGEMFADEYYCIAEIARYSKSIVIWKGIAMGAGLGISMVSNFRIATDSTTFAMPESAIGVFNDVGSCFWLHYTKSDALALFLGMSGFRINGADCYHYGLATHYIPDANLPSLIEALKTATDAEIPSIIDSFH